ncbi:MAG: hypothetical protein ACTHU0_39520 [Kofleriaceae bacterium]
MRDLELNAAALRGFLYGLVLILLGWFAWPDSPAPEPGYVAAARHDVAQLRRIRDSVHVITEVARIPVARTREQVLVIDASTLELRETPTAPPRLVTCDPLVVGALVAERHLNDAQGEELHAAAALSAGQDSLSRRQDQAAEEERARGRWEAVKQFAKGLGIGLLVGGIAGLAAR